MKRITFLWLAAIVVATLFAYHSGYEAGTKPNPQYVVPDLP